MADARKQKLKRIELKDVGFGFKVLGLEHQRSGLQGLRA